MSKFLPPLLSFIRKHKIRYFKELSINQIYFIKKLKKKVEGIHDEKNQSKAETEDERDAVVRELIVFS